MGQRKEMWVRLEEVIQGYVEARIDDSWKGGGDPISVPTIEARLILARAELSEQIDLIRREYEDD